MENSTLKIGELSKLFGISKQTLQYYDKIGLFKPAYRDDNGYRVYFFQQSLQLASILYFIDKGFSLEDIKSFNENLNVNTYLHNMNEQYASLSEEILRLIEERKTTKRKINFVKDNINITDINKIWIEYKPSRFYYSIGDENKLYIHDGFYKNPTVVFYNDNYKHFACYLYGEKNNPQYIYNDVEIETIPSGDYLCGYHLGDYSTILKRVHEIRGFYSHLDLDKQSIHFNIIDQFVESDKSKFITEINIRVIQKST